MDPRVEIGHVHLSVEDVDRALRFYREALGFEVIRRAGPSTIYLGAGDRHHIVLVAAGDTDPPAVDRTVGRFSLRFPTRASLAAALARLDAAGIVLDATADHGSYEALYIHDPDGHDIELYAERAVADGPVLAARPADLDALRAAVEEVTADPAAAPEEASGAPLLEATRVRLRELRTALLNLHKALLEDAKTAYELDRGSVGSNASLLQLVIADPWFAWLHPVSELVVRIDETLADGPGREADGAVLLAEVGRLFTPGESPADFASRYYDALQRQPAVVVAHAEVRRILRQSR